MRLYRCESNFLINFYQLLINKKLKLWDGYGG